MPFEFLSQTRISDKPLVRFTVPRATAPAGVPHRIFVRDRQFSMPKRNLRVIKWVGTVPAVAVCTLCNQQFKVPLSSMKRVSDAQQLLKNRFAEHERKGEDDRQGGWNMSRFRKSKRQSQRTKSVV